MRNVVWIASYPKSGNTWLRFVVAHLVNPKIASSADVDEIVPDIHSGIRPLDLSGEGDFYLKTHLKFGTDMPLRRMASAVVYILRNPLDVLVSNLNYRRLLLGAQAASPAGADRLQGYVDDFIRLGGDPEWIRQGMGTWNENVGSWLGGAMPLRRHLVRYEEMRERPDQIIAGIAAFLKLRASRATIATIVAKTSFAAMRRLENQEIARRKRGLFADPQLQWSHAQGLRFMSQGRVGAHRDVLSREQLEAALAAFGPQMRQLGYLAPEPAGRSASGDVSRAARQAPALP